MALPKEEGLEDTDFVSIRYDPDLLSDILARGAALDIFFVAFLEVVFLVVFRDFIHLYYRRFYNIFQLF